MTADQQVRVLYEPPAPERQRPRRTKGPALLGLIVVGGLLAALLLRDSGADTAAAPALSTDSGTGVRPSGEDARTLEGATAAAVRFLARYGSAEMYDPERRRRVLEDVTSPSVLPRIRGPVDEAFGLAARNLGLDDRGRSAEGPLVARTVPIGVRVVSWTPSRAVVSVWTLGLLGVAGLRSADPVQETWSTETVTLDWTADGWRWAAFEHEDGPAPIGSALVPADAATLARTAREFVEVGDAG